MKTVQEIVSDAWEYATVYPIGSTEDDEIRMAIFFSHLAYLVQAEVNKRLITN